jgi:hypothetical protein
MRYWSLQSSSVGECTVAVRGSLVNSWSKTCSASLCRLQRMIKARSLCLMFGERDHVCCRRKVYDRIRANRPMTARDLASHSIVAERS